MNTTRHLRHTTVLLCLLAAGCRAGNRPSASAPFSDAALRTTDGQITKDNIDSQIDSWEHVLKVLRPGSVQAMAGLVDLYQTRAQYFGAVAGYDRAEELAERAVASAPRDPEAWLARASSRAALHRFSEALLDLAEAEQRKADFRAVRSLRAAVLQAQGHTAGALELRRAAATEYGTVFTLGALGSALATAGEGALARQQFAEAVRLYRDTSPLPIAWIDFQRGLLAEKEGEMDAAAAAYAAALARLPQFAPAAGHLAAVESLRGHSARAIELLRPLVSGTDDPEYAGQLAELTADPAEASRLRAQAARRYGELLARHPQAFADHAARFFLAFDPARALSLARQNLGLRRTAEAFDLALSAAVLAHDAASGCAIADEARSSGVTSRRISTVAARACPLPAVGGGG